MADSANDQVTWGGGGGGGGMADGANDQVTWGGGGGGGGGMADGANDQVTRGMDNSVSNHVIRGLMVHVLGEWLMLLVTLGYG